MSSHLHGKHLYFDPASCLLRLENGQTGVTTPKIFLTKDRLDIGCMSVSREAFQRLQKKWEEFIEEPPMRVIQE